MNQALFIILLLVVLSIPCACSADVTVYPIPDPCGGDCQFDVYVNNVMVPVEQMGRNIRVYYARFQFSKPVRAAVSPRKSGGLDGYVKPARFRKNVSTGNGMLSFDIDEPGARMVSISIDGKKQPPIFVIAEKPENNRPDASNPGFINIEERGIKPGNEVQTSVIQKVLDECASLPSGGTVFFPPGIYRCGTIRIGPNTTVYLSAGTVLKASDDPKDFPTTNSWTESGGEGVNHSFSRFIHMYKADNSKLCGYGVIDGNGHILRNIHNRPIQILDAEQCRNITIENVVLRNSASWTCHVLFCDGVIINNLKIFGDWEVGNTDGIDPDSSRNVIITNYFGYCGDDAIAIKCTNNSGLLQPCENITVKNAIVVTRKTSFKLGTESRADMRNILFENCEAVESSRGIGLWMRDGGTFENVTFRDINLDLLEIKNEIWSGEPYRITVEKRHGLGKIKNVTFERVKSSAPFRSVFLGHDESFIEDIKFVDCEWTIKPREDKKVLAPANVFERLKNVTFSGVTRVNWLTQSMDYFNGFIGLSRIEGLAIAEVLESWPEKDKK